MATRAVGSVAELFSLIRSLRSRAASRSIPSLAAEAVAAGDRVEELIAGLVLGEAEASRRWGLTEAGRRLLAQAEEVGR